MSDKKNSDSGSRLKSIEDVIGTIMDKVVPSKNFKRNLPLIFDKPIPLDEFIEKGPFIIPRDKEGNIIPFEQPDRKPFIIPRDKDGNRIPFDPDEFIQLLSSKGADRKTKEGSVTAREVEVAGAFEEELLKKYEDAKEAGYTGSFYDFLMDQMDPDFDPAERIRISRLPEGIMQLMNMMQNKRTT